MATARKRRAYSYVRFSSRQQAKGGSLKRQTEAAARYCEAQGLKLDPLNYRDLGVSAFSGKNVAEGSALSAFIAAAESGRIPAGSILLIENLDRLSRQDALASVELFARIVRAGIEIRTLQDGAIYTRESLGGIGLFQAAANAMAAHHHSKTLSDRARKAWAAARKTYGPDAVVPGQKVPFWLRVDPKTRKPSVDPKRGKVARQIALAYLAGDALREIVRDLNDHGVKPPGNGKAGNGRGWSRVQISRTLRALAGRDGPSPLNRGERARLRAALARRRSEGRPRRDGDTNILRLLGRCAYCERPLNFSRTPKTLSRGRTEEYAYLRCTTNAEFPGTCSGPQHVRYDVVAQAVVELALAVADNPQPASRKAASEFRKASDEAARLIQKAEALTASWEAAPTRETAGRVRDAWLAAQKANEAAETAWGAARPGYTERDGEAIRNAASDAQMNAALRAFLTSVDVRHETNGGNDPGRGTITFRYAGGGKAGIRYVAAKRTRADAGKPKRKRAA